MRAIAFRIRLHRKRNRIPCVEPCQTLTLPICSPVFVTQPASLTEFINKEVKKNHLRPSPYWSLFGFYPSQGVAAFFFFFINIFDLHYWKKLDALYIRNAN